MMTIRSFGFKYSSFPDYSILVSDKSVYRGDFGLPILDLNDLERVKDKESDKKMSFSLLELRSFFRSEIKDFKILFGEEEIVKFIENNKKSFLVFA